MCGFVGVFLPTNKEISAAALVKATNFIGHRGPDDTGFLTVQTSLRQIREFKKSACSSNGANLGFGFKRLSIVDLSENGHQPMLSRDSRFGLVFNGEIYNAPELKKRLSDYPFKGNSDTEVILALYEKYGIDAFPMLNGMFAIAFYDFSLEKLFLVRDRMGIKPLYYSVKNGQLHFASEIKSLLAFPNVEFKISPTAAYEHFSYQFCLGKKTLYQGIDLVEPGEVLAFSANDTKVSFRSEFYWTLNFAEDNNLSIDDYADHIVEALFKAVKRQVRSDVPLGSLLSGGLDSSAICAISKMTIPDLQTFTCGFDLSSLPLDARVFDESADARNFSKYIGSTHHELKLGPGLIFKDLNAVSWHLEDPRVGISYQIFELARFIKKHVTVVLNGTGGDELFGGYFWKYNHDFSQFKKLDDFDRFYFGKASRLTDSNSRRLLFNSEFFALDAEDQLYHDYKTVMSKCTSSDFLNRIFYFDMKGFLQGLLLTEDKLNMAHSIEARVPFLDNDLVDLSLRIPSRFKFDGNQAKIVFKKALSGIIPDEVIQRRKQGFTPPDRFWLKRNASEIEKRILSEEFLDLGFFNRDALQNIIAEHVSDKRDHRFLIWSLLCFGTINTQFVEGVYAEFGGGDKKEVNLSGGSCVSRGEKLTAVL